MPILMLLSQGCYLEDHWVREKSWGEMKGSSQVLMSPSYLCLRCRDFGYQIQYSGILFRHSSFYHTVSDEMSLSCWSALHRA